MRDPNSRLFVAVTLCSSFGSSSMMLVAPVWTLSLTGSAALAAMCGFFAYAPSVFGPAIGVIVDRLPRLPLLIWTNAILAGVLLTLTAVRSARDLWLLFTAILAYGTSFVIRGAGEAALLPAALPSEALITINGYRMSVQEGMKLVAPLVGASMFTWAGGAAVSAAASCGPSC